MKALWITLGVIGVIALIIVLTVVGKSCAVVDKVTNPDRIIYTYEWFFNTYASIQSYEEQLANAKVSTETFKTEHAGNIDNLWNSQELARLHEVERGLYNQLVSTVNQYNANGKNITRSIFKDPRGNLPYEITVNTDGKIIEKY